MSCQGSYHFQLSESRSRFDQQGAWRAAGRALRVSGVRSVERRAGSVRGNVVRAEAAAAAHLGNYKNKQPGSFFLNKKTELSRRTSCTQSPLRNTDHVHDGAQADEPARWQEDGSSLGVRWKLVAGLCGVRAGRLQRLG